MQRREDRQLFVGALLVIEFCIALAQLLRQADWELIWEVFDVKWWATTLQFVGALWAGDLLAHRPCCRSRLLRR